MMDGKVFRLSEGLDRTYEELKPAARVWGIVWRASLDRTYEELKPAAPAEVSTPRFRFDRTYEPFL